MDHVRCKPCSDREDRLHGLVAHAVAVKEVRLIRDKFTGQPRGFCFMEFHSVADAARALQLLQVLTPPPLPVLRTSLVWKLPTSGRSQTAWSELPRYSQSGKCFWVHGCSRP